MQDDIKRQQSNHTPGVSASVRHALTQVGAGTFSASARPYAAKHSGWQRVTQRATAHLQVPIHRFWAFFGATIVRPWQRYDRRYGLRWRAANFVLALFMLAGIVLPVVQQLVHDNSYMLSAEALKLVGPTNSNLENQLTYDAQTATYQFNKSAIDARKDTANPVAKLLAQKNQIGMPSGKGTDRSMYGLDVPTDFSKGVTYHDVNSQLSFSLVPQFTGSPAKQVDGHLVFPLAGETQAIYTLKNNGLKEDIVIPKVTQPSMTFNYTLQLPKTLEARTIPDSNGAIGIYSADPALFGNISYGSQADQATIEKARENAQKTNLVFGLPAPVIKDTHGDQVGNARFSLQGNILQVMATDLNTIRGAFTIDPSVVVTSSSDFQTGGNNEGNIDFSTSGQLTRGGLTGGGLSGSFNTTGNTLQNYGMGEVAYNGYMYEIDGFINGSSPYAAYAAINSDGTVGNWTVTSTPSTSRVWLQAAVYDGYIYAVGGYNSTDGALNTIEYAPLNSDGSIGTWQTASSTMPYGVCREGVAVANGYMYVLGGANTTAGTCGNNSTPTNYVQYAPIYGNGSLGSFTSSANQFTNARYAPGVFAYNGNVYVIGGSTSGWATIYSDVQYAHINSDGTLSSWVTSPTGMTAGRTLSSVAEYNGYVYLIGGVVAGVGETDTGVYAPIYANGATGAWNATASLNNSFTYRYGNGVVAYNGYVYSSGGATNASVDAVTEYTKIDSAGMTQAWATDSTHIISAARSLVCVAAYNGYLYAIGGSTSDSGFNNVTTVQYAAINADGTLNGWNTTTALPATRGSAGCTAYNGYMYVVGGYTGGQNADGAVLYIPINSNGSLGASWTSNAHTPAADLGPSDTPASPGVYVYGGYIYSVGGDRSGGSGSQGVFYAPVNSDGSIGTWVLANLLTNNYKGAAFAQVGNYLYGFGGNLSGTAKATVEYAIINSDGTVGAWTATGSMPGGVAYSFGTTVNGCIYSVGGEDSSGNSLNVVYYACPNSNGTITSWNTANSLTTATTDMGVAAYHGMVYGVGGYTTAVTANILTAGINNGGSGETGTWATGGSFTTPRDDFATVAYNGYLYIMGGENSSKVTLSDVQVAPISSNGSIGAWTTTGVPALPQALFGLGAAAYDGFMYVLGGATNTSANTSVNTTYYAPIHSDGSLGAWQTGSTLLAPSDQVGYLGEYFFKAVAYNGYLYQLGGDTCNGGCPTGMTQYAKINSDGSVGTWAATTLLPFQTLDTSSFAANGYVYVLGGWANTANPGAIIYAPIHSDGSLGAWAYAAHFPYALHSGGAAYYDGYVYYTGGLNSSYNGVNTTVYAPVNADGSLGQWQQEDTTFTTGRTENSAVTYNGYLYMLGGSYYMGTGTFYNDSQYTPLSSIARIGHYSKLVDFGGTVNVTSASYNGTAATVTYRAASSNGIFGAAQPLSTISGTGGCIGTTSNTRYLYIDVTLDDSSGLGTGGIFPDAAGTNANLTDLTINYTPVHPPPNIRLRAGQTLQNGALSVLDTCYP